MHYDLPVVRARRESLVEETVFLLSIKVVEDVSVSSEQPEREEGDSQRKDQETTQTQEQAVFELVSLPALLRELLQEVGFFVNDDTAE